MKQYPNTPTNNLRSIRESEQGVYILLVALLVSSMMALIALAVDGGRLYVYSIRLQQAVDAATLVGARQMSSLSNAAVEALAIQVAQANLLENGHNLADSTISAVVNSTDNTITVNGALNVESVFFGKMLAGREWNTTRGVAKAQKKKVAVVLVVDRTGSMGALVQLPDLSFATRMDLMKDAAISFAGFFGSTDRVGMVSYSENTSVDYDITQAYDPTGFIQAVNNIPTEGGYTNIQIGVLRGLQEILKVDGNEWERNMVILTDGVPNRNGRDNNQEPQLIDWAENLFQTDIDVPNTAACRPSSNNTEQREDAIAAQRAVDLVRQAGVRVFTVGFGTDFNTTATPTRPWGTLAPNSTNTPILKSFMRWMANDVDAAVANGDVPFFDECVNSYTAMANNGHKSGMGLISNDPSDVSGLLSLIGSSLTLRLIQ